MKRILMATGALAALVALNLGEANAANSASIYQYGWHNGATYTQRGWFNRGTLRTNGS